MAINPVFTEGYQISAAVATGTASGDPVYMYGVPAVALDKEGQTTSGESTCRRIGVYDLSVKAVDDSGNTVVNVGDDLYFVAADTPKLSKKTSGTFYGKAMETITTYGGTSTIRVMIGIAAEDNLTSKIGTSCEFLSNPVTAKVGGGAASGTATHTNVMSINGINFEYNVKGTQTITGFSQAATGLDVSQDQTADDGTEITRGILANAPDYFTVGTSGAFYAKLRFSLADVSGTDDCAFGFRKAEAYQANIDDFDEMACLNVISGDINIETILNNGATVTTDTTLNWADTETHELEVHVSAAGVVTYKVDGVTPPTVAAYTFDDAEKVIPFFFFLHDTDVCDTVILRKWEVGRA